MRPGLPDRIGSRADLDRLLAAATNYEQKMPDGPRASAGGSDAPTFFGILTAAAWLVFRARGCVDVVLETGLGGRLDATNVCAPAATAVTTIEREHTQLLGDTVEQIAAEKAGI